MADVPLQQQLDYAVDAQTRVAADTLCIDKSDTWTIPVIGVLDIPNDVIRIDAVRRDGVQLPRLSPPEYATWLAASASPLADIPAYSVVGRRLYLTPIPTSPYTVSVAYKRRPVPLESGFEFELEGEYDDLAKRLATTMVAIDGGEPEIALSMLGEYRRDVERLRVESGRKRGVARRVTTPRDRR